MQKNVAGQKIGAQLVSATDGSAFTGSVTVYVTGDAGTQAVGTVGSGACTHEGNGYHTYAPSQAETNYDLIAFTFTGTGAVPVTIQVPTRVDANVIQLSGTSQTARDIGASVLISSGTGTGQLSVSSGVIAANVTQVKGTTSAGQAGYVGLDWQSIANQDAIVSLSATTISTVTTASNMISQANVRTAIGLASANLDTQLGTIAGYIDTEVAAIYSRIGAPAGASIAADIAAVSAAALTAAGVWTYVTRTLTATGNVVVISTVLDSGAIEVFRGCDHLAAFGRAITFTTEDADEWGDLDGTPYLRIFKTLETEPEITISGTILQATGANKSVRFEPTAAQTLELTLGQGRYFAWCDQSAGNQALRRGVCTISQGTQD